MKAVEQQALRMAGSDEPVLILGDTGVGKDLLARFIHHNSLRRHRPFVHLNCAALSETLLESELFGHMRGAYTGATETRPGQFEIAADGTIYLDEIGELPPRLQAKLLHVLQERRIYRVGGRQALEIKARVLAATNRDLVKDIRSGAFRRDLFYRLGVVTLKVPPLSERPEDLEVLALHFFRHYVTLYNQHDLSLPTTGLTEILREWNWPGNVRELENVIKRVILLGRTEQLHEEIRALGAFERRETATTDGKPSGFHPGGEQTLKEVVRAAAREAERSAISQALNDNYWNRKKAAGELKVSYRSLLYKIKEYNLTP
jgi:two-component system response regulator AtoC